MSTCRNLTVRLDASTDFTYFTAKQLITIITSIKVVIVVVIIRFFD
jgi:hypothetical protein